MPADAQPRFHEERADHRSAPYRVMSDSVGAFRPLSLSLFARDHNIDAFVLDRVFVHALNTVKRIPRTGTARPPAAERLMLYGLYKQSMGEWADHGTRDFKRMRKTHISYRGGRGRSHGSPDWEYPGGACGV